VVSMQTLMGAELRCPSCLGPSNAAQIPARMFQKERRALLLARREFYPPWARPAVQEEELAGPGRWDQ
jgi:hypothetical protein